MNTLQATIAFSRTGAWTSVWLRNALVWRTHMIPFLFAHVGEGCLYLALMGYGLSRLIGEVNGTPFIEYYAAGWACAKLLYSTTFEGLYQAHGRMSAHGTWKSMLNTSLTITDITAGEAIWAASKGTGAALILMLIAAPFGLIVLPDSLIALIPLFASGLIFALIALSVTAISPNEDYFLYYFTVAITPMLFLGQVFFPLSIFPDPIESLAWALPFTHTVALVRPILTNSELPSLWPHLAVLVAYLVLGWILATSLLRRRMLQ